MAAHDRGDRGARATKWIYTGPRLTGEVIDGSARLVSRVAEAAGEAGGAGEAAAAGEAGAAGEAAATGVGNTRFTVEFPDGEERQEVTLRLTPSA